MNHIKKINSLKEAGFTDEVVVEKTREQWESELIEFGFSSLPSRRFGIPYQNNPLYVAMADERTSAIHGTNPRIMVPRNWRKDKTFKAIAEREGINILESNGLFIEGYDFPDRRSVQDIGSFMAWLEGEYRVLRAG